MDKHRAIPAGYMTVGALAKKMNTTVRTLQYYDKEGLLSPSAESEGGRRLYTDKDVIMLHQIQSMKYLGFSLDDIKNRLVVLDTPEQVAAALTEQAGAVREKIASLSGVLRAIETLKAETRRMNTVNFHKYADIVTLLQMGNDTYWVVKEFDDKMWAHIRNTFDEDRGLAFIEEWKRAAGKSAALQEKGVPPESEAGQSLAKEWWDMILEFTGGDMSLLPEVIRFGENRDGWDAHWREQWEKAEGYITAALTVYFTKLGYNPFDGESQMSASAGTGE